MNDTATIQANENQAESKAIAKRPKVALTENGLVCKTIEEAWRFAQYLAKSQFVPERYQDKPGDCLVAIDMAQRLRVSPLMFLQNAYVVYGRPGLEAKLVIALINQSGLFTDPLDYEVEGNDPKDKKYRVRAFATRASTGKMLYGPWITWDLIVAEGWDKKQGSKWKTIPEVMFHYRAASWFANRHCPEVKMGMMTADELYDEGPRKPVEAKTLEPTNGRREKFGFSDEPDPLPEQADSSTDAPANQGEPVKPDAGNEAKEGQPPAQAEGLYTCTACGAQFDEYGTGKTCPHCAALNNKIKATVDVKAEATA